MKAVILAGGKGTRMGHLTRQVPKPMLPLNGRPLLHYQIDLCQRYGLEEVIIIINHLGEVIEEYFGDGAKFGIPIRYYREEKPLGTVGGIKALEAELQEDFLVLYGDVMLEMDLPRLVDFHRQKDSQATLVVHPNDHPHDSDLVEMDAEERIVKVWPKPHPEDFRYHNMVNAAVYLFTPAIFDFLEKNQKADFGKDIFPQITDRLRIYGYNTPEFIKDMGTPERIGQVEERLQAGQVQRRSLAFRQKAIFLDRDGVLNEDVNLIHRPEHLMLYPFAAKALRKINGSDYLAVLATNQSVVARSLTSLEGLGEIHKKMETDLGRAGAKLDAIYFCPHHPDRGYPEENPEFKIDCDCRKPKPGMLTEAAGRYNINLSKSWMIGDSERDTLAGQAAGCRTVGVMTGQGHREARVQPDYFFAQVEEAVDFILNEPYRPLLQEAISHLRERPTAAAWVIAVGGNSRSGKSTLSTYLAQELQAAGHSCLRITLDDWIRPKAERQEKDEVFYNFRTPELEKDLTAILNGRPVTLDAYRTHTGQATQPKTYQWKDEEIVIIDGVVALSTPALRQLSHWKIFIKIDETLLQQRFELFYHWKGYTPEETDALWESRLTHEYRVIARDERYAHRVEEATATEVHAH